jgi:hypothetical protein
MHCCASILARTISPPQTRATTEPKHIPELPATDKLPGFLAAAEVKAPRTSTTATAPAGRAHTEVKELPYRATVYPRSGWAVAPDAYRYTLKPQRSHSSEPTARGETPTRTGRVPRPATPTRTRQVPTEILTAPTKEATTVQVAVAADGAVAPTVTVSGADVPVLPVLEAATRTTRLAPGPAATAGVPVTHAVTASGADVSVPAAATAKEGATASCANKKKKKKKKKMPTPGATLSAAAAIGGEAHTAPVSGKKSELPLPAQQQWKAPRSAASAFSAAGAREFDVPHRKFLTSTRIEGTPRPPTPTRTMPLTVDIAPTPTQEATTAQVAAMTVGVTVPAATATVAPNTSVAVADTVPRPDAGDASRGAETDGHRGAEPEGPA